MARGHLTERQPMTFKERVDFKKGFRRPIQTIAATGSIISDAAQLNEGVNIVTGANGTKGVILPDGGDGTVAKEVIVLGTASAVLKVWPKTGAAINALSASAAMSLASGPLPAVFLSVSSVQWYSLPLLPS
jgi:hypothetical protein